MNNQPSWPQSPGDAVKRLGNLQNFRTLQFAAEFLFFSKYGEESGVFQEFLAVTEMVKIILKLTEYYRSYRCPRNPANIFLEKHSLNGQEALPTGKKEELRGTQLERIKQMLNRIK